MEVNFFFTDGCAVIYLNSKCTVNYFVDLSEGKQNKTNKKKNKMSASFVYFLGIFFLMFFMLSLNSGNE